MKTEKINKKISQRPKRSSKFAETNLGEKSFDKPKKIRIDGKILAKIKTTKYESFSELFALLSKEFKVPVGEIARIVNRLIKQGKIKEDKKHSIAVQRTAKLMTGKVCGTSKNYVFIKVEGHDDFFVPGRATMGAMDGDEVKFRVKTGDEAEIVEIITNANKQIVGKLFEENESFYVVSTNTKISKKISIPRRDINNAKSGEMVVVEIVYQPTNNDAPVGKIVEVFSGDECQMIEQAIRHQYQISETFPDEVEEECEKMADKITLAERNRRADKTKEIIVTIDGADAKDLDDAISIKRDGEGYILGVHIADVGEYVKYKTPLDEEAYFRGTSVYFPNVVFPMLPKKLSNNLCSLNQDEEKLALSVTMKIDKNGIVKDYKIEESIIKSCARLTYAQVYDVLCGKEVEKCKDIKDELFLMQELATKLEDNRTANGALDLDIPEAYFELDENNNVLSIHKRERNFAHRIIESFMILCNEVVAKHYCTKELPFVYRVHEKPTYDKVKEVVDQLAAIGVYIARVPKEIKPTFIQELLAKTENKEYAETANKLILRAMQKARYFEQCLGHFGLGLEYYCHFTSPIRRYPDLCIHRIIKQDLRGELNQDVQKELEDFVVDASDRSSQKEKNADEAERDYESLLKTKYISKNVGDEFEGQITGLTEFGIFVELDNMVEGMIKVDNMPDDEYKFDEKTLQLKGRTKTFRLGQRVKIKVISANLQQRRVEFELI